MYLKYLAVEGFKSFPEWNGLELAPGTCVLVGANGTGKSNLTEARLLGARTERHLCLCAFADPPI